MFKQVHVLATQSVIFTSVTHDESGIIEEAPVTWSNVRVQHTNRGQFDLQTTERAGGFLLIYFPNHSTGMDLEPKINDVIEHIDKKWTVSSVEKVYLRDFSHYEVIFR